MSCFNLYYELHLAKAFIIVIDGALHLYPENAVNDDLVQALRANKEEILWELDPGGAGFGMGGNYNVYWRWLEERVDPGLISGMSAEGIRELLSNTFDISYEEDEK